LELTYLVQNIDIGSFPREPDLINAREETSTDASGKNWKAVRGK
jgi:methionine synthase II (cobalamin-independent)